jgi:O-antigen ligase
MTPTLVKNFIVVCLCAFVALVLGFAISTQSYDLIVLPVIMALFVTTMVVPGYGFLIAFGLTCPFALPLPFVWGMPMILFMLGLCALKHILRRALGSEKLAINYSLPVALFFGWVLVRYCINPVTPGIAIGVSEGITGFRAYLNYAICAALFFAVGLFRTEAQIVNLLRWICGVSALWVCVFLPMMFTKSFALASLLPALGIFVDFFENGWLRFVILPDFGLALICAGVLPNLFKFGKKLRVVLLTVGLLAVVLGGNRSSTLMLFAVILIVGFLRYRWAGLGVTTAVLALAVGTLYYIGENGSVQDPAVNRIAALVSPKAADVTGAAATVEWRKVRWERAMEDIREHPLIGMSYGGLENAFVFATWSDYERAKVDMDVATGGIHNGYLANARALGIPSLIVFICLFSSFIVSQARQALKFKTIDPFKSDLHAYLWVNLVCVGIHIYIGTDLNDPSLWFFMSLCTLVQRLKWTGISAKKNPDATAPAPLAPQPSGFALA